MDVLLPPLGRVFKRGFGTIKATLFTWKTALVSVGISVKPLFIFGVLLVVIAGSTIPLTTLFTKHTTSPPTFEKQSGQAVLGASTSPINLSGIIEFNIPAQFNQNVTFNKNLTVSGTTTLNGPVIIRGKNLDLGTGTITASNVIYNVNAGSGLSVSGTQNPTITNTGVLSFQGATGNVTLTAGSGININGTTISSTTSSPNEFATISNGTNSFSAGSSTDTLTLTAGTGVTITTDTTNKKLTFSASGGSGGLSGLTADGVVYATSGTTVTTLAPSTAGYLLQTNGNGLAPSWVSPSALVTSLPFSDITTAINTAQTLTVGNGSTLDYSGTGIVDANQLLGGTWNTPGTIGSTTPNIGMFTTLSSSALTVSGSASISGLLTLDSSNGIQTTNAQTLTLGSNSTGNIFLNPKGGNGTLTIAGNTLPFLTDTYDLGSPSQEFNNIYVKNLVASSGGGVSGYWQLNNGALSPTNITNDLLIGGISTASAKFQVSGTTGNITATGALTGLTGLTSAGTVQFSGLAQGIAHLSSNGTVSSALVNLTSDITNTLGVANGGTGQVSFTTNGILYGNGTSGLQVTAAGSSGDVLQANGSGVPVWTPLSVSGGAGGNCSNCLVSNPSTNQIINPTGNITGLSVAQTSTISPSADIFNVTDSSGLTKYMQVDSSGNISLGGTVSFTKIGSTSIGTSVTKAWTLNGNSFNNRRSITVTNGDATNTLPINYEVTLSITGATATDLCNNTQSNNNDLRIAFGVSTEIARNITRNCTTSLTITFLLQAAIAPGASDIYYIYYNNSSLAQAGPTYTSNTQTIDNADNVANWTTSDSTYTPISQDTANKQEGTGSVKTLVTGGIPGVTYPTSTGADGTLDLSLGGGAGGCTGTGLSWNSGTSTCTINDTTKSTYNFTTINIPSGTTLTITGTTAVPVLVATGNVTIAGTVNLQGLGYPMGTGPGHSTNNNNFNGGGGSYAGVGGDIGGPTYSTFDFGSGPGTNGFCTPGVGGGSIQITTPLTLTVSGTINANGSNGCSNGSAVGGAGSGGYILVQGNNVTVSGTLSSNGGAGTSAFGDNSGGGGGGYVVIDYLGTYNNTGSTITANGGHNGEGTTAGAGIVNTQHAATSLNQTVTLTTSPMDLSSYGAVCFYVRQDTAGQFMQFGFGKTSISEQTYNITVSSTNSWQQQCFNIAGISAANRQNITKFGFTVNNVSTGNVNFWFDFIVAQTTAGFTGTAPTLASGATLLGTQNLTLNGQGLGAITLNYDPTNALAGTGGLNLFNGGSTSIFNVDGSGNASASGTLTLAGANQSLHLLNGKTFTIQTSPGGDAGLSTRLALLNNGFLGLGTISPGSLFDVVGGTVGINTTSPFATLDARAFSGTTPIASFSGQTAMAGLVVDNAGKGDLFTASSSGLTRFVVTQNGNAELGGAMSIGTISSPSRILDVVGNAANNGTGTSSQISIYGPSSTGNRLNIGYNTTSNYGWIEAVNQSVAWQNLYLQPSGGSVGINTTSANAELSLGTSVQTNKLYLYDGNNDKYGFGIANNTLQIYSGVGGGVNETIQFGEYNGTTFTELMRLQNGNLGINSGANPFATLDVRGTSGTTPVASVSGQTSMAAMVVDNKGVGDIFTASSSGATRFTIANNGNITINGNTTQIGNQTVTGNLSLSGYATMSASLSIGSYGAPSGVGNAVFSGNVGIGTNNATQALTVAGNASIYNTATGRGDIYTATNLDKSWNTTALFNSAGTTFSAGMQNPAVNNRLNLSPNSPLTGWAYRKPITVTSGGSLTNYQVSVTMDTASLISAGKMNSDCSDMRFTDSDGTTLLNYWIESGCNTTNTKAWVLIPSISTTSYTIYLYYGNFSATSASNIKNTFQNHADDFAGTSIDGTIWTTANTDANRTVTQNNGLTIACTTSQNCDWWASTYLTPNIEASIPAGDWEARVYVSSDTDITSHEVGPFLFQNSQNVYQFGRFHDSSRNGQEIDKVVGNVGTANVFSNGITTIPMYFAIRKSGSTYTFLYSTDNTNWTTDYTTSSLGITPSAIALVEKKWTTTQAGSVTYNNFYIRNYTASDPTTSVGSETGYYTSGTQSWTSDTLDAGSGKTYLPNFLTVSYTLDGSDNIAPKFQVEGSDTGTFAGEQTVYPAGSGTYYQNGGTYSISSGVQLDITSQVTTRFRYWKVVAYLDTGSTTSDTPIVTKIELADNKPALSLLTSGNVGLGTTTPLAKLDVSDTQSSTVSAFIRNTNAGGNASALALQVGNINPGTGNYFLSFLDGAGRIVGKIQGNGSGGVTYATTGIDFAEYYKKASDSGILTPGTIVCTGPEGTNSCTTTKSILGVVSNRAGFAGGAEHSDDPNYVLVGLVGQLPVKVATDAATIVPGDPITTEPNGTATKAIAAGEIVGHALTSSADSTDGTIMVSVNPSWYDPDFYASATDAYANQTNIATVDTATISGTLNVLGRTTVTDLGITGDVNDGIMTIHGLQGEINTLAGDLKLQSEGLGGVDILNGLVTIDTTGDITTVGMITAQTVTAGKINVANASASTSATVLAASAGVITIPAGQTTLDVHTNKLTGNSLIFVTPDIPVAISAKKIDTTTFRISLSASLGNDVHVNWWVVN